MYISFKRKPAYIYRIIFYNNMCNIFPTNSVVDIKVVCDILSSLTFSVKLSSEIHYKF